MPFAAFAFPIRLVALAVLFGSLALTCWAQEPPTGPTPQATPETRSIPVLNYTKPASHFPNPIAPYRPRHLAPPNLANTARIDIDAYSPSQRVTAWFTPDDCLVLEQ